MLSKKAIKKFLLSPGLHLSLIVLLVVNFLFWIIFIREARGSAPSFSGERNHDFGFVYLDKENSTLSYTFNFLNDSKETRVVSGVGTSCSCTVVDLKGDRIFSGERFKVPVEFDVKKSGPKSTNVIIKFVNGEQLVARLHKDSRWKKPFYFRSSKILIKKTSGVGKEVLIYETDDKQSPPRVELFADPHFKVSVGDWFRARGSGDAGPRVWHATVSVERLKNFLEDKTIRAVLGAKKYFTTATATLMPQLSEARDIGQEKGPVDSLGDGLKEDLEN